MRKLVVSGEDPPHSGKHEQSLLAERMTRPSALMLTHRKMKRRGDTFKGNVYPLRFAVGIVALVRCIAPRPLGQMEYAGPEVLVEGGVPWRSWMIKRQRRFKDTEVF